MEVYRTEPVVAILGAGFSAVANVPLTPDFRFDCGTCGHPISRHA